MNIQEIQSLGYLFTTIILVFSFWKMGGNTASTQVIATYKEQVEQLREQVSQLTAKVGELTGVIKEKDDRIKTLEAIATNRNPEMEIFIKNMTQAIQDSQKTTKEAQEYMKSSSDYLHTIKNLLTVINAKTRINKKEG